MSEPIDTDDGRFCPLFKRRATDEEWDTIEPGDGEHLCWCTSGDLCEQGGRWSTAVGVLCDEVDRLRAAGRAARFVADHLRKAALQHENTRLMAHPLNLVLNALDGATDPTMLGIEPEAHDAFRAALGAPGDES